MNTLLNARADSPPFMRSGTPRTGHSASKWLVREAVGCVRVCMHVFACLCVGMCVPACLLVCVHDVCDTVMCVEKVEAGLEAGSSRPQ